MKRIALRQVLAAGFLVMGVSGCFGNPTGGQIASGSATITTVPGTVTINQASNIAIINWQSFSIGSGELTHFVQPSAASAALNRVLGGGVSAINGTLSANGQIVLINGNGIVVGAGGTVNASSFVASTRDINDADFLAGNLHFTGSGTGGVQNLGTINALGGDVYLIGKTVDNEGKINAASGTAGLASGDDVMLNLSGQEHVFVNPSPTATASTRTAVQNGGTISAASAELKAANGNLFALAINNAGAIRATSVSQQGGRIFLTTDHGLIQNTGVISAKNGSNGGQVKIKGGSFWNRRSVDASGDAGGQVTIDGVSMQNDGDIDVSGSVFNGGTVKITYAGNVVGSIRGLIDASGKSAGGAINFFGTGPTSEAYLSLTLNVNSSRGTAGQIGIDTATLYLTGATLTANGATGGGRIFLGQDDPSTSSMISQAQVAFVSVGTAIEANAMVFGDGGQIGITGHVANQFSGVASAKGKGAHSLSGMVTLSGSSAQVAATVMTSKIASAITPSASAAAGTKPPKTKPSFVFTDPDPGPNNAFGRPDTGLFNLSSNTTLITSPGDSFGGAGAGAAYLFSDYNGALLSTIRGSHLNDNVGALVLLLSGNTFAISMPNWNSNTGAVTFGNGQTGFANGGGAVSAANSLVGAAAGDQIGSDGLVQLFSGSVLVLSPHFDNAAGAVTFVDPSAGITGVVGSDNSLVGAAAGDSIGSGGIQQLSNGVNYLVLSPSFDGGKGAITNGFNNSPLTGVVSSGDSLVGASSGDAVGTPGSIIDTGLGYYLVTTATFDGGAGAVTWNSTDFGTTGVISAGNSLVGSVSGDHVGSGGITVLLNGGNYVVSSPDWNGGAGAVTLGSATSGVSGAISASNSLVGSTGGEHVGSGGIEALLNSDNFVVFTPDYDSGAGAVTIASNFTGVTGVLSSDNSLVGATSSDDIGSGGVMELRSGNLLVLSPDFNDAAGAVTFVSASNGLSGVVGSDNSLVGAAAGDHIGSGGIHELDNDANYLVLSPDWKGGRGAVSDGSELTGIAGVVGSGNSLVGATTSDHVGSAGSIISTYDNYFLVYTPDFRGGAGAVTWSDDASATTGVLSSANSLVGSSSSDHVGGDLVQILPDNSYVVVSSDWNNHAGAVTVGSADGGVSGFVGAGNSLVGGASGDRIGDGGIINLFNGLNFVVLSPDWSGGKGAVTNIDPTDPVTGVVSAANSLVGANAGDAVGSAGSILQTFSGYYLVITPQFDNGAGAVTWNDNGSGRVGEISSANSLVGSSSGDNVGSGGITLLNNGNYVVDSPNWDGQRGAVTLGDGSGGATGAVSSANSLVGAAGGDALGSGGIVQFNDGNFVVLSPNFDNSAGAVTWGDESAPIAFRGVASSANSLVGAAAGDMIGSDGIVQLSDGADYLVLSSNFDGGRGAVTQASDAAGVSGVVGATNSLVGASAGDAVGTAGSVLDSGYGYYLMTTAGFNGGAGAVTWNRDNSGSRGVVSAANSLVGAEPGDAIADGGITILNNGNYVVDSPDWKTEQGAVTLGLKASGVKGLVGATNSLVGAKSGDRVGSDGISQFLNSNFLILSSGFNDGAGAVTFAKGTARLRGVLSAANSLVGAKSGDALGSGGIQFLANNNYLVLSPEFGGGAGAVSFGSDVKGVKGVVGAKNSLVGAKSSDHIGSGGIIQLSNGNYLVQSPLFNGSAGAVTWGSRLTGSRGVVTSKNSLTGGSPDAGEEYEGESANGNIFLVAFTTDTSGGGDGRVLAGSVNGPGVIRTTPTQDFFLDPAVLSFEAQEYNYVLAVREFYIADPSDMGVRGATVDALEGGAVNTGRGDNIASGSSTANASGPKRLVVPGNGIWNIFAGTVHAAPPPAFVAEQLRFNLSREIFSHLNAILFGQP